MSSEPWNQKNSVGLVDQLWSFFFFWQIKSESEASVKGNVTFIMFLPFQILKCQMMFEENITTISIYNNLEPRPEPQTTNKQTNKQTKQ